jgi:hypothetical protein
MGKAEPFGARCQDVLTLTRYRGRTMLDPTGSIFVEGSPDEARRLRHSALLNRSAPSSSKSQDALPPSNKMPGVAFRADHT